MTEESQIEITESKSAVKRVSLSALVAIVISIGAILISLNNIHMLTQDKINFKKEIIHLQNSQNAQSQNALANISYLIHLANLHLVIGHDPKTALNTLLIAQQELAPLSDNIFINLKNALTSDINALRAASPVSVNDTFINIENLNQSIQALSSLPAKPDLSVKKTMHDVKATVENTKNLPWYDRVLDSFKQLKGLFVIRHLDQTNAIFITPNMEENIKQNIAIKLNIAQWALLNRNQTIFQAEIHSVKKWVEQYFSISNKDNKIIAQLDALQKMQIHNTLPTLQNTLYALSSVKIGNKILVTTPTKSTTKISPVPLPKIKKSPSLPNTLPTDIET
ncbi:MAG TPA: uroporphyrinogen-III C-methyltransferase [Coxiellaceae bacterium]|nr:MAG: hypothetical protein A3E81_05170 [Gammaproteobacteria bacterium RIFCSPHIGHO2_12_FULL_36_30]HLB55850.1 uroporphyrinogen-III C-methyltransferase [Coxiellaceae bacterium]